MCTFVGCRASFIYRQGLVRHVDSQHRHRRFVCDICDKAFSRDYSLVKHRKNCARRDHHRNYACQETL